MENSPKKKISVHEVLARSYSTYLVGVFIGIVADHFYPIKIVSTELGSILGFILLVLGGVVILWAQMTSGKLRLRAQPLQLQDFKRGPYAYTRQPTNVGLIVLVLGLAFLENSLVLIVIALCSFLVSRIFINKQEQILCERYGDTYACYRKEVKRWF